jgi:hypothetical protein
VDGDQAGPGALGILVPPGQRTMLILRPRALDWDLLPARPLTPREPSPAFLELHRDEAASMAQKLVRFLEAGGEPGRLETLPSAALDGYWITAEVGALVLLACRRAPGQAYQPMLFVTLEQARSAAARTTAILFPPKGAEQELYFNTRNFAR